MILCSSLSQVTYGEYFVTQSTDGCRGSDCIRELDVPYADAVIAKPRKEKINSLSEPARSRGCSETVEGCGITPPSFGGGLEFTALVPASLGSALQAEVGTSLVLVPLCQAARTWSAKRSTLYLQLLPKALVSKMPGYFFSSYGAAASIQNPMVIVGVSPPPLQSQQQARRHIRTF